MKHTEGEIKDALEYKRLFMEDNWEANLLRGLALWNAANGMTTEQAVAYLRYGKSMVAHLKWICEESMCKVKCDKTACTLHELLTNLEVDK